MIRQEFTDELDKGTRNVMIMMLVFPGVVAVFPFLVGILSELDLLFSNEEIRKFADLNPTDLPLVEWGIFVGFCLAAFAVRWRFTQVEFLLSPVKPDPPLRLPNHWKTVPKHGHELKALVVHQRFATANGASRVLLVLAGFPLISADNCGVQGIAIGSASILILLYFKVFLPNWSNLEEAMRQVVYQPVESHLNPNDYAEKGRFDSEEEEQEYREYLVEKKQTEGLDADEEADFREFVEKR